MGKIYRLSLAIVGILVMASMGHAQQPLRWEPSIDAAKQVAARSNRLVLIEFSAPWCGQCRAMETEVFNRPGIAGAIEANYVPVRINVDFATQTAKQYGITLLPTTVIIASTPRGEVLDSIPGRLEAAAYLTRLNRLAAATKGPPAPTAQIAGGTPPAPGSSGQAGPTAPSPPPPAASAPSDSMAIAPFGWSRSGFGSGEMPGGAPSTKAIPICLPAKTSSGGFSPIRTVMPRSMAATTWCRRWSRSRSCPAVAVTALPTSDGSICLPTRPTCKSS